jgi:GNAT superfamily N-acetyltransferase
LSNNSEITYLPLTPDRWHDFEHLFGSNGACGGCWCTWWRLSRADFNKFSYEDKKNITRTIVQSGKVTGLLAFEGEEPVAWVALGPREEFPALERSKILARVDDQPVWCINCFYIEKLHRLQGLMTGLIAAAVAYARSQGAAIVEAYPVEPHKGSDSGSLYYGVVSCFATAGFVEVARRSEFHPVMRFNC